MPLRIFNSLTRQKEDFIPLDPQGRKVSFYNCGPTVYGPFHIGNARNFTVVDVMRRWMEASGYQVRFVQNITDIDDKIINRANQEGRSSEDVATEFTALFYEHMEVLGLRRADEHPRATEYIPQMIAMLEQLIEEGHAYSSGEGSVWFSVTSFEEYGKLSRKNIEEMREGERVNAEQQSLKRSPLDFCLWKGSKPGEPAWDSPWGPGRPGWHTECAVMARDCHHSPTIDIHSGGFDLQFPHHENEIAQCECVTGKPFARYWIHNGFLNIDGEKMSKSLGNFKTIDALLTLFDALTLRHFLLTAHYRTELNFTEENLKAAKKASGRYAEAQREAARVLGEELPAVGIVPSDASPWASWPEAAGFTERFTQSMDDDFNTAQAFAVVFDLVTRVNKERVEVEHGRGNRDALRAAATLLSWFRQVLGVTPALEPSAADTGGLTDDLMQLLVDVRSEARQAKQYALADLVRDRLGKLGITLEDRPGGTGWKMS